MARLLGQWRLVVACLILVGCLALTVVFSTSVLRVPAYSDLVMVSGQIEPTLTYERPGGKSGAVIRVRLVGGGDLRHEEHDLHYREVATALRGGGFVEAWVEAANARDPYSDKMWQLRHNDRTVFTYEEAVAFRTGPQPAELIVMTWGFGLLMVLYFLRPREDASRSGRRESATPLLQIPQWLYAGCSAALMCAFGLWLLGRASETRYSLDVLYGLILALVVPFILFLAVVARWKEKR